MSCCEATSNGQSSSASAIDAIDINNVVAHFNFREQPSENLTTGSHTIESEQGPSLAFLSFQQGTTFDILAGTGLRFRANATSTAYTPAAAGRTAAVFDFLWGDFFTAFDVDATRDYLVKVFCSLLSIPSANSGAAIAGFMLVFTRAHLIPVGGIAENIFGVNRHNAAGAQALRPFNGVTGGSNYTTPLPNAASPIVTNALALQFGDAGLHTYAGDYDPATTEWDEVRFRRDVGAYQANTAGQYYKDQSMRVGVAFPTGQTTANMAVDVTDLVIELQ